MRDYLTLRTIPATLLPALLVACGSSGSPTDAASPPAADASADVRFADLALVDRSLSLDIAVDDVATVDALPPADAPTDDCTRFGGAACFLPPPGPVRTNRGPLDFSCRESPRATSTEPGTLRFGVEYFGGGGAVADARIDYFADDDSFASPVTRAADSRGLAVFDAPVGTPNRTHWRVTAAGALPTFSLAERVTLNSSHTFRLFAVTPSIFDVVHRLVGLTPAPNTTVIASAVDDCDGHALENVVLTLSRTSSTVGSGGALPRDFVPGAKVFYFQGDTTSIPVPRDRRIATGTNGLVVIFDVPITDPGVRWYLQAWGQRTEGETRLMGETPVRTVAGAVMLVDMQPFR